MIEKGNKGNIEKKQLKNGNQNTLLQDHGYGKIKCPNLNQSINGKESNISDYLQTWVRSIMEALLPDWVLLQPDVLKVIKNKDKNPNILNSLTEASKYIEEYRVTEEKWIKHVMAALLSSWALLSDWGLLQPDVLKIIKNKDKNLWKWLVEFSKEHVKIEKAINWKAIKLHNLNEEPDVMFSNMAYFSKAYPKNKEIKIDGKTYKFFLEGDESNTDSSRTLEITTISNKWDIKKSTVTVDKYWKMKVNGTEIKDQLLREKIWDKIDNLTTKATIISKREKQLTKINQIRNNEKKEHIEADKLLNQL